MQINKLFFKEKFRMQIFIDADACPKVIKEILYRAAERTKIQLILVANQFLPTPHSKYIKMLKVAKGFDIADNQILQLMLPNDLVITADIPLADLVIQKGGIALNPRGQLYTSDNIKQRLSIRNLMEQLRETGIVSGGPNILNKSDRLNFANQLDRILTKKSPI